MPETLGFSLKAAMRQAGQQVFSILRRLREDLGVNSSCGASNVSFGLPNRPPLNAAFLSMAIGAGLTSAITNPIETEIKQAILAADVMMGHDENCQAWIAVSRNGADEASEQRPRRERRRRRER